MKIAKRVILLTLTWPMLVVGWSYVLLFTILFAAHQWRLDKETLVLSATWRPWVTKIWKYSTTISRGIIYQPSAVSDERTQQHEGVHVRQVEDRSLLGLILGVVVAVLLAVDANPWWSLLGFWVASVAFQLPNFLGAVLRGGHIYRDAEHERSAYAQTDLHHMKDESWLTTHQEKNRTW